MAKNLFNLPLFISFIFIIGTLQAIASSIKETKLSLHFPFSAAAAYQVLRHGGRSFMSHLCESSPSNRLFQMH
jgi:hypothetical protein